ncbi:MAG: hypothetical protein AB8H79_00665 [Myxococcota bacterium]
MIQPKTVLRDTAIALLPALVLAVVLDGWWALLGAALCGVVVLANVFVLGRLTQRLTAYLAGEDPNGSMAVVVLIIKFPVTLGLITLLAWVFGGIAVALGLAAMVSAIFVRGLVNMLQAPVDAPQGSS